MPNNAPSHAAFTAKGNGIARVLITPVLISKAFNPSQDSPLPMKKYNAIWDTGATGTVITRKVADECGLTAFAMTQVHTASGQATSPVYLINIGLPNNVGIADVRVTEGILTDNVEVLIGMDIIAQGDFAITNHEGKTTFSFRCPSCATIDFVQQPHNTVREDYVGRNEPCPCGSGKKYKKCHGR